MACECMLCCPSTRFDAPFYVTCLFVGGVKLDQGKRGYKACRLLVEWARAGTHRNAPQRIVGICKHKNRIAVRCNTLKRLANSIQACSPAISQSF